MGPLSLVQLQGVGDASMTLSETPVALPRSSRV
jgi:hypothetical protein